MIEFDGCRIGRRNEIRISFSRVPWESFWSINLSSMIKLPRAIYSWNFFSMVLFFQKVIVLKIEGASCCFVCFGLRSGSEQIYVDTFYARMGCWGYHLGCEGVSSVLFLRIHVTWISSVRIWMHCMLQPAKLLFAWKRIYLKWSLYHVSIKIFAQIE